MQLLNTSKSLCTREVLEAWARKASLVALIKSYAMKGWLVYQLCIMLFDFFAASSRRRAGVHPPDHDHHHPPAHPLPKSAPRLQQRGLRGLHVGSNQDTLLPGLHHQALPRGCGTTLSPDDPRHALTAGTMPTRSGPPQERPTHCCQTHLGHSPQDQVSFQLNKYPRFEVNSKTIRAPPEESQKDPPPLPKKAPKAPKSSKSPTPPSPNF